MSSAIFDLICDALCMICWQSKQAAGLCGKTEMIRFDFGQQGAVLLNSFQDLVFF